MSTHEIKIGDRIKFRAITRWSSSPATRIVNGFSLDRPTVRFGGWSNFVVQRSEIIEVIPS